MADNVADKTKDRPVLHAAFRAHIFVLAQRQDGVSNGTALWRCGQVLAAYAAFAYPAPAGRTSRALELGSGVGYTALALASLGYDVLATDTPHVVSAVLAPNIAANAHAVAGTIAARELDWTAPAPLFSTPFDVVLSADTLYAPALTTPLLRTLAAAATAARAPGRRAAPVLLCLERRDPALIDAALREAAQAWGFAVSRVPGRKLRRLMPEWGEEDWEDIELYKLALKSGAVAQAQGGEQTL